MTTQEQQKRFEEWATRYSRILHHTVYAFSDGTDREDLLQEVLLTLWRAVPAFRGDSEIATFIYRVAHNTALTWKRSKRNYRRRVEEAVQQSAGETAAGAADERSGALEQVYRRIRTFPELDRSLLLLWLDEVSYRDIAKIHGIAENLVGVRLNRARNKLIAEMKEELSGIR